MPDVFGTAFFTIGNYNPPTGEAVLPMGIMPAAVLREAALLPMSTHSP